MRVRIIGLDVGGRWTYENIQTRYTINRIINIDPFSEYGRIATVSEIDRRELSPRVFCPFLRVNGAGERVKETRLKSGGMEVNEHRNKISYFFFLCRVSKINFKKSIKLTDF